MVTSLQKHAAKPDKAQLARARKYIEMEKADWRYAKSMPQWPHEYVLARVGKRTRVRFCGEASREIRLPGCVDEGQATRLLSGHRQIQILGPWERSQPCCADLECGS